MEQTQETEKPKVTRICELPGCGKEFTPTDSKHKYCSNSHRARASFLNRSSKMSGVSDVEPEKAEAQTPPAQPAPSQTFLQPKAQKEITIPSDVKVSQMTQFIIDNLREQRDDWKAEWNSEREERRKVTLEKEALEKKLRDLEHEMEIKEIRGEKPSALQGLADSGLMQYLGPAVQEISMGLAKAASSKMGGPAIPGMGDKLEGLSAEILSVIAGWLPKVSEPVQNAFQQMMILIIQMDEQSALYYLSNIVNLIQNGTTARPTGTDYN